MTDNANNNTAINLQWYPGHMKKTERLIRENLKLVDVVIEILDARLPLSSANPLLSVLIGNKPRLIVLNKADLANEVMTKEWTAYFARGGTPAVAVDAVKGTGTKLLVSKVAELARAKTDKLVKHGAKARAARCMIVGIPNVGKSSLINRLAGNNRAKVENRPGVTRAIQWIRLGGNLELLDMPGILWPKFESQTVGLRLAFTGAINDDIYDREAVCIKLLELLRVEYSAPLCERFKLDVADIAEVTTLELLEIIAHKRGCILKGGVIDNEKVTTIILSEFRQGKLGNITLDKVSEEIKNI